MNNDTTCIFEGCERPSRARGWCNAHYLRWWKHGDPDRGGQIRATPGTADAALDDKTAPRGDCLVWTGNLDRAGYGLTKFKGKTVYVHRYAWERANGPIPDGMHIDHVCHTTACIKVEHLRLATPTENARNRNGARADSATGVRGVFPDRGRFRVRVRADGVRRGFGTFDTLEEAREQAIKARAELFGTFSGNP